MIGLWDMDITHKITKWRLLNISGPSWLIHTKTSPVKCFYTGLSIFDANLAKSACLEDRPPWRSSGLHCQTPEKYIQKAPTWWSFGLDWSKGAWDIERPPFCHIVHIGLQRGPSAKITENPSSVFKKHPLGEVLVWISQPGPEILSSLRFVMLCPYLRGQSTFRGYFFTS